MIAFWIAAALLSAAAAAFILQRAARAARLAVQSAGDGGGAASAAVYRRQLAELDELAERGLLPDEERRSARAEAARRLLRAADKDAAVARPTATAGRWLVLAAAAVPLAGAGLYLLVGAPGDPDQPFLKRVAQWRAADPALLNPGQMVAVLQVVAAQRPTDPQTLYFLSRAQLASGDAFSAEQSLKKAIQLRPRNPAYWAALGETFMAEGSGAVSTDAQTAFNRTLALDPTATGARYFLARGRIASGDVQGGVAAWRALLASLPADDPRHGGLAGEIAQVEKTGALAPSQPAAVPGATGSQQAFIRSMVASLAARLQSQPDDPAGWGRLIRSYGVLGDQAGASAARTRAEQLFKGRPDALRVVEAVARGG